MAGKSRISVGVEELLAQTTTEPEKPTSTKISTGRTRGLRYTNREKRTERLDMKVEPSIKDKICNISEDEGISMTQALVKIVKLGLAEYEKENKKKGVI